MMKMIASKLAGEGTIQLGHSVLPGYFEQDQEEKLDTKKTVFETIDELAVGEVRKQVRGILGSFLFRGDDIDKKVQVLSGGERGRLALCKLLLQPYNLLLLDEPTNHLDIRSKDILKRALLDYEGTVVMVSHDRDFMKGICNRLFEFRDGHVKEHLCDIEEFMELRKVERLNELDLDKKKDTPVVAKTEAKAININPNADELKSLRSKLKKTEELVEKLELDIKTCDTELSDPNRYNDLMNDQKFFQKYEQLKKDLEKALADWETITQKIDTLM